MQTPEQKLWAAYIVTKVADAIHPFKIPDPHDKKTSFDVQVKEFRKKIEEGKFRISVTSRVDTGRAILFLESEAFDTLAGLIGYDSEFVNRTFAMVQKYITARKQLLQYDKHIKELSFTQPTAA